MSNSVGKRRIQSFLLVIRCLRVNLMKKRQLAQVILLKDQNILSDRQKAILEVGFLSSTDLRQIASHRLISQSLPDSQRLSCPSLRSLKEEPSSRWSTA